MAEQNKYLVDLGNRIRDKRLSLNLSQDELAKLCGYTSRASINKIELGYVDLPLSKVLILAEVLGVPVLYIIDGETERIESISEIEETVIKEYRRADYITREAIHRLLNIDDISKKKNINSA